jgi:hypothetical protein
MIKNMVNHSGKTIITLKRSKSGLTDNAAQLPLKTDYHHHADSFLFPERRARAESIGTACS